MDRGYPTSKVAWSGVTVSDILQTADWSSQGTFQSFYHQLVEDNNRTSFGKAVFSLAGPSNLHVDVEMDTAFHNVISK